MPVWKHSPAAAEAALAQVPEPFVTLLRHGSMSVEWFRPEGADTQTPHRQDELYVIASGHGVFFKAGERVSFAAGDLLFVEAGVEHRFESFSADFATWVIFYGPDGGEAG